MAGMYDEYVGQLSPGQVGWLPLDAAGNPTGPATLDPPPPPAFACSVMANPAYPLPEGEDLLLSSTGAPLIPPLQSNVERRDDDWQPPVPGSLGITFLNPNTAVSGDPTDIDMMVHGSGFTSLSVITFNGLDEPTTLHSDTMVSTGVKPSLFIVPAVCPVQVRNGTELSNSVDFTFTEAPLEDQVDALKRRHRVGEDDPISTSPKRSR